MTFWSFSMWGLSKEFTKTRR